MENTGPNTVYAFAQISTNKANVLATAEVSNHRIVVCHIYLFSIAV
jgi:hypothetical protein